MDRKKGGDNEKSIKLLEDVGANLVLQAGFRYTIHRSKQCYAYSINGSK